MHKNTIGLNIKYLRGERGISQKYIADKIGAKTSQQIGKYERGESLPPLNVIYQIAEILNVDAGALISKDMRKGIIEPDRGGSSESSHVPTLLDALKAEQDRSNKLEQEIIKNNKELAKELGLLE